MSEFPKMLYRPSTPGAPDTVAIDGQSFDTLVVADAHEEEDAIDDGWAGIDDLDRTERPLTIAESESSLVGEGNPVADTLRDELIAADEKLKAKDEQLADTEKSLATANGTISTLRTEVSLANDRIATLQTENAELTEKLAALDADGDGNPGGSLPQDPPVLSGKTKAELLKIAADEKVEIEDGALNADIIAAIELKREANKAA